VSPGTSRLPDDFYDPAAVQGLFDRMSRSYERMNVVMSFGFSVRWRRQLMRLVPTQPAGTRVLDAMSGMGETWSELLRRFPDSDLAALDFSQRMIEHGATRNASRFENRFTLHCKDMLGSELSDSSFDVVVSAYGLKTFNDEQSRRFADELARILRPGGRFAFIEVTEPANRMLRALYDFYLSKVVPVVGVLLVSDPVEYRMLYRYLRRYGRGQRSESALVGHPLLEVEIRRHFFGCATSFSGHRIIEPKS
jgi:demethylmenaquinone methyltransferase/2-methoxy-6-polyprenyl-1,4-benzoquinol methylase